MIEDIRQTHLKNMEMLMKTLFDAGVELVVTGAIQSVTREKALVNIDVFNRIDFKIDDHAYRLSLFRAVDHPAEGAD